MRYSRFLIRGASAQLEPFLGCVLRSVEMALKQSAPLAPHLSLLRALSQARMNLKCCSLVDEHWGAIVKRLKNHLLSRKAKGGIGKSWLYGQVSEKVHI